MAGEPGDVSERQEIGHAQPADLPPDARMAEGRERLAMPPSVRQIAPARRARRLDCRCRRGRGVRRVDGRSADRRCGRRRARRLVGHHQRLARVQSLHAIGHPLAQHEHGAVLHRHA